MKSVPPVRIELRHSTCCTCMVGILTIATIAVVMSWPGETWLRVAVAAGCAFTAVRESRAMRRVDSTVLQVGVDRRIRVTDAQGRTTDGMILDASYVSTIFTAIVWRPDGIQRASVLAIWPDSVGRDEHRRMRIWLRLGRTQAPASKLTAPSKLGGGS
ncbi:MAG: protein YgfX [Casimicrobiaceae bacterium]